MMPPPMMTARACEGRVAMPMRPSPAPREREGPNPKGWEGEGGGAAPPSPGSLSLATLSRGAGEGQQDQRSWLGEPAIGILEAAEIVVGIGDIVELQGGMALRDHAPQRLAQQRGAFHRVIAS